MDAFFAAGLLAVVANRIVAFAVEPVKQKWPGLDLWWLIYVTWIVGGALSYLSGLNIFVEVVPTMPPLAGQIVTAVGVGGGSQLLHEMFKKQDGTTVTTSSLRPSSTVTTVSTDRSG